MNGQGYIALDWMLCVFTLAAFILQAAVWRSPDVPENVIINNARRVRTVAWLMLTTRFHYVMFMHGDLVVPIQSVIPLLLLTFSDIMSAMGRLFGDRDHKLMKIIKK